MGFKSAILIQELNMMIVVQWEGKEDCGIGEV